MALTLTDKIDYCVSSTRNYIEAGVGIELQPYFLEICDEIDKKGYERIAIKACHAVGKTHFMGALSNAIMGRFRFTKLISTAPTFRQVHDLLWKEIKASYNSTRPYLQAGRLNETEWWIDEHTFARGFSPAKTVKSESGQGTDSVFQGYHAKYLTVVIFDEAVGVLPQIWEQAEGLLTSGERVLFIAIANPTSRNCKFFDCFQDPAWKTYSITCFDSPNLKASGIHTIQDIQEEADYIKELNSRDPESAMDRLSSYPKPVPYLINTRWVIEKAIEWGVTHPLFRGKVIGEFPESDSNSIITIEEVKNSQSRVLSVQNNLTAYIGLDVARFGEDSSVLTAIIGDEQVDYKKMVQNDTNEVSGHTINFIEDLKIKYPSILKFRLAVDGGFGHGVIDRLKEIKKDMSDKRTYKILKPVEILEINFGASDWVIFHFGWVDEFVRKRKEQERRVQEDRQNYTNYKAKMFYLLSKDIKNTLKLLNNSIYVKQLPKVIMQVDSKGRLKIESKDDYKKRTGESSPDEADSLALANFAKYFAVKPTSVMDALSGR